MPTKPKEPLPSDTGAAEHDLALQYPPAQPEEVQEEAPVQEEKGESGSIWAKYTGHELHDRGLTAQDQIQLGIPKDKVLHAGDPNLSGAWWTRANRHRLEVTKAHPLLLQYLEEDDPNFTVQRF